MQLFHNVAGWKWKGMIVVLGSRKSSWGLDASKAKDAVRSVRLAAWNYTFAMLKFSFGAALLKVFLVSLSIDLFGAQSLACVTFRHNIHDMEHTEGSIEPYVITVWVFT